MYIQSYRVMKHAAVESPRSRRHIYTNDTGGYRTEHAHVNY